MKSSVLFHHFLADGPASGPAQSGTSLRGWGLHIAGVCCFFTCVLSASVIASHLISYTKPAEQKWVVMCIFMVPLYSLCDFTALWSHSLDMVASLICDCYEAAAIYAFSRYLIACLGGEERAIQKLSGNFGTSSRIRHASSSPSLPRPLPSRSRYSPKLKSIIPHVSSPSLLSLPLSANHSGYFLLPPDDSSSKPRRTHYHPFPLSLLIPPWAYGRPLYEGCKFGIVQYMVLKGSCAVLQLILEPLQLYSADDFDWRTGYPYMALILNFSQCWALYCVLLFYHASYPFLLHIRPLLPKFLLIKAVIFVTWWQSILFALLFSFNVLEPPTQDFTSGALFQSSLQHFFICIEMCVAAVAAVYVFPARPYEWNQGMVHPERVAVLGNMADLQAELDPQEVVESERVSLPLLYTSSSPLPPIYDPGIEFAENLGDVVWGGSDVVVADVRDAVHVAVEPLERGMHRVNTSMLDAMDLLNFSGRPQKKPRRNRFAARDDAFLARNLESQRLVQSHSDSEVPSIRRTDSHSSLQ